MEDGGLVLYMNWLEERTIWYNQHESWQTGTCTALKACFILLNALEIQVCGKSVQSDHNENDVPSGDNNGEDSDKLSGDINSNEEADVQEGDAEHIPEEFQNW